MWVDKAPIQPHFMRPCLQSPRAFTTALLWGSPRQSSRANGQESSSRSWSTSQRHGCASKPPERQEGYAWGHASFELPKGSGLGLSLWTEAALSSLFFLILTLNSIVLYIFLKYLHLRPTCKLTEPQTCFNPKSRTCFLLTKSLFLSIVPGLFS